MDTLMLSQVWNQLLQEVDNQTTYPGCSRWLHLAKPNTLTEDTLLLDVPNRYTQDSLQDGYQTYLEETLTKICGLPMKITYHIAKEKNVEDDLFAMVPEEPEKQEEGKQAAPVLQEFQSNLSPKYEFENFVVGNSNRFARAAAMAVANNPANAYNPFFLYSDSGLGKTHLMNAIGNRIHKNHPEMKILYISSETFTNELISSFAIGPKQTRAFREKYRNIDVLLIDDIQFLRNQESTQEEFFHTFNALEEAHKQIIISSDRPPAELVPLEERLISRFSSGLTVDIQHPDLETRMAILRNMAVTDHTEMPNDVVLMIASSVKNNVRELEGAYTRVCAYATLTRQPITLELTRNALKELNITDTPKFITVDAIQQLVASTYKLKVEELLIKKRTKRVAYPRQIAIYLTRELAGLSLDKIGEKFGGRDHSTIIHAWEKIKKEREKDPELDNKINTLITKLKK